MMSVGRIEADNKRLNGEEMMKKILMVAFGGADFLWCDELWR